MKRLLSISLIMLLAASCQSAPQGDETSTLARDPLSELTRQVMSLRAEVALLRAEIKAHSTEGHAAQNVLADLELRLVDLSLEYNALARMYTEDSAVMDAKRQELIDVETLLAQYRQVQGKGIR